MHRRLKRYFLQVVMILFAASTGYAAIISGDTTESNSNKARKWGAGINNLPWENPNASIWWWKNDSTGHMLRFGLHSAPIYVESYSYAEATINGSITYYHLRRSKSIYRSLNIVHGWGVGGYLRATHLQTNHDDWYSWLSIQVPWGIEHQPFQSLHFLRYSILIDFTGRLIYEYQERQHTVDGINVNDKDISLNFSFTTQAQFWLVWYFH